MKDRVTVLADCVTDELKQQNEAVRCLHQEDIDHGFGRVYLPFALARKYPNADRDLGWQLEWREATRREPSYAQEELEGSLDGHALHNVSVVASILQIEERSTHFLYKLLL